MTKEYPFRTVQPELVEGIINPIVIAKGSTNITDIGRAGQRPSMRENLFEDLGIPETSVRKAYGSENLKNTHSENFHSDNDKTVEKEVTTVEETPAHSDGREDLPGNLATTAESFETKKPNPASKYKKDIDIKSMSPADALDSLMKDYGGGYDKTDDTEEVDDDEEVEDGKKKTNLKLSLDWVDDLEKAKVISREGLEGGDVVGHTKEGTPVYSSPEKERKKRKKLLVERLKEDSSNKSGSGNYEDAMDMSDEEMAKKIKRGLHENSRGVMKKKKSELDDVYDLVKDFKGAGDRIAAKSGTETPHIKSNSFIRAAGPGGVQFDFGDVTGNPIADTYNSILAKNIEPIQAGIAEQQRIEYGKAMKNYIKKGEDVHTKEYSQGEETRSSEVAQDQVPNNYREQFHETTVNIGGEVVKAQSETDMYVLKQHEDMFKSAGNGDGPIIDVTGAAGGGVVIDALSGKAFDVITGQEVETK